MCPQNNSWTSGTSLYQKIINSTMYSINFCSSLIAGSIAETGYRLVISRVPVSSVYSITRPIGHQKQVITSLQLLDPGGSTRLHLVQPLDELDQLGPTLILKLVLVASQHGLEYGQQLRSEATDGLVLPFV